MSEPENDKVSTGLCFSCQVVGDGKLIEASLPQVVEVEGKSPFNIGQPINISVLLKRKQMLFLCIPCYDRFKATCAEAIRRMPR
jgi:hypothetical protein